MSSTALLDYRFGWRWLVPSEAGADARIEGFAREDAAFLRTALADDGEAPASGTHWVVDADGAAQPSAETARALAGASSVSVVGSGGAVRRWRTFLARGAFERMREYGLLPYAQPRVVVPLHRIAHTRAALRLHTPGRPLARAGVRAAALLAEVGIDTPLRRRTLLVATRHGMRPRGAGHAQIQTCPDDAIDDFALYLGTPNDNRKTVALPLGRNPPDTLWKSGTSPTARAALRNEHSTLSALATTNLAPRVPAIRTLVDDSHGVTVYEEYRLRVRADDNALRADVTAFLAELSALERQESPLCERLRPLRGQLDRVPRIRRWLDRKTTHDARARTHRGHGDFAPWNISSTSRGLFVFDWEEARRDALALSDAFYFVAAPRIHGASPADPSEVARACLAFGNAVAYASGIDRRDVAMYFALFCLERAASHPFYMGMLAALERDTP